MKLVSMKYTPAEKKEEAAEAVISERPEYSWGLEIHLDDEALSKLGIDVKSMPVGTIVNVTAIGKITGTSMYERDGQEPCSCLDIQLTDMAVEEGKKKDSLGSRMYDE